MGTFAAANVPLRCRGAVYSHSVIADFAKLFLKAVDQARPTGVRDNSKPAVAGGAKHDIASYCIHRLQSKCFMFLTNHNVEVISYKDHKKCVYRNFYVCFTKFGTLF